MYVRTSQSGLGGLGATDGLVASLGSAIKQVEGYNPNFAPNNNPGNLVFVGQKGAVMGAGGFAKFPTPEAGQAAMEWQIQNYIDRGYTLTDFFMKWAPPNTKNAAGGAQTAQMTANYIGRVSSMVGVPPDVPLKSIQASYGSGSSNVPLDDSPSSTSSVSDSPSDSSDPGWLTRYMPDSSETTYDIAGLVLSESELLQDALLVGAAIVGVIVLRSIL